MFSKVCYLQNCIVYYAFCCIIVTYLALIRLPFAELGIRQIKRRYIQYYTIPYHTSSICITDTQTLAGRLL